MTLDPQAEQLNLTIKSENPHVFAMLSKRGQRIYFPKLGILSQSADAAGKDINATMGTALEDNGEPMCLESIASRVKIAPRNIFNYAPSPGRQDIRKVWKTMLCAKNPSLDSSCISLPVVTCALTHGLSMAGYLFADEGDRIILPDLYWENYDLVFSNAYGASLAPFPMFNEKGGFNTAGLEQELFHGPVGKKIVLLNFPNNPTGYTVTDAEAIQIRNILVKAADAGNDIAVLIDDAYFGLVFEKGIYRESIFSLLAHAHPRILAVKFDGATKEDYVWGFRIGFVTFGTACGKPALYQALEAKLGGAIRGNISNSSNLSQSLLYTAWTDDSYKAQKAEKFDILKRRFTEIRRIFETRKEFEQYFTPLPFNSGYFMCVKLKSGSAEKVRQNLLERYNTGIIAFNDLIRVAFSSTPFNKLETLFDNIYKAAAAQK